MKKCDFKKLALMGIAGGIVVLSGNADAAIIQNNNFEHHLAQASCGNKCGQLADNQNYGGGYYYAPSGSCGANQGQAYYPQQSSCAGITAYDPHQSQYNDQQWGSGQWNTKGNAQQYGNGTQQWGQGQQPNQSRNAQGYWGTSQQYTDSNTGNLTESDLQAQLNSQGRALYQSLSPEGKALALKLANQDCKGRNECRGYNSCRNTEHSCQGQGSCAGTSAGPFADKNAAVKVAAMKMAEKRARMNYN